MLSSVGLGGVRCDDEVLLACWSTETTQFSPLGAEAVALGHDLPGCVTHPWTRARIRDWFARSELHAAKMPPVGLSEVRQETTAALFERLARHGVSFDEASFTREVRRREGRSAWELAADVLDAPADRIPVDCGLSVCELWRRLVPDRPSLEMLDELMQEGYAALNKQKPREAVEPWLSFTEHLMAALDASIQDLGAADAVFPGLQCISNWVWDAEVQIHNLSLSDPELARRGIAWCEALSARFPGDAATRLLRMEQSALHMVVGEPDAAVAVAEALRALDPHDASGYVALSNVYSWRESGQTYDLGRAAAILEEALRVPVRNGADYDLKLRIEDLRGPSG